MFDFANIANIAKESCDFAQDIFYGLGRFCAIHPVWANVVVLPIITILNFILMYLFFDFLEEKYLPKIRRFFGEIKKQIQSKIIVAGAAMMKATRKVAKKNIYLGLLMVPVFLTGKLLKGGGRYDKNIVRK